MQSRPSILRVGTAGLPGSGAAVARRAVAGCRLPPSACSVEGRQWTFAGARLNALPQQEEPLVCICLGLEEGPQLLHVPAAGCGPHLTLPWEKGQRSRCALASRRHHSAASLIRMMPTRQAIARPGARRLRDAHKAGFGVEAAFAVEAGPDDPEDGARHCARPVSSHHYSCEWRPARGGAAGLLKPRFLGFVLGAFPADLSGRHRRRRLWVSGFLGRLVA